MRRNWFFFSEDILLRFATFDIEKGLTVIVSSEWACL